MGDTGSCLEAGAFFCADTVISAVSKMKIENNPAFFIMLILYLSERKVHNSPNLDFLAAFFLCG